MGAWFHLEMGQCGYQAADTMVWRVLKNWQVLATFYVGIQLGGKQLIIYHLLKKMKTNGLLAPSLRRLYPLRWPLVMICPLCCRMSSFVHRSATVILLPLSLIHYLIVVFVCPHVMSSTACRPPH